MGCSSLTASALRHSPHGCRWRVAGLVIGLACLSANVAWAGETVGASAAKQQRAWLARAYEAASRGNYQGVLVVSADGAVSASRVAHFSDGRQQLERIEALDGISRGVMRVGDAVYTLWPASRIAVVEQRPARTDFPALPGGGDTRLLQWYELHPAGLDRIAGHDAEVMLLKARDALRFSQRLWAERQTGLLLRADVLEADGRVLESSAFSELAIGVRPQMQWARQIDRRLEGFRIFRPTVQGAALAEDGWRVENLPAGFEPVRCVRRWLNPADEAHSPQVLQTTFSDGLTSVSLFIEPFDAQAAQSLGESSTGAANSLRLQRDRSLLTVVGDVPQATLRRFADALVRLH